MNGRAAASDTAHDYLRSILLTPEAVRDFLAPTAPDGTHPNHGWTYDADLGWVHTGAVHVGDGVDGSATVYRYESDGARRVVNSAGDACRIHSYGNSFTHCDQVNDGETWQEYLAAHLREPVRNYGVGGYSVYQAYRRMRMIERRPGGGADYVILNIFDDDHFRNLDSWRRIRAGSRTMCGFTLPHLRVNVEQGTAVEFDNLLRTPKEVFKLCDPEWVLRTFSDDPVLRVMMSMHRARGPDATACEAAVGFGIPPHRSAEGRDATGHLRAHTEAAIFATIRVLEMTEGLLDRLGRKLLVMLSFGARNMIEALQGSERFDQRLLDFLSTRTYPVIDMRDAFVADDARSNLEPEAYLDRYYNGHHTPWGNFFTAWSAKDAIGSWIDSD